MQPEVEMEMNGQVTDQQSQLIPFIGHMDTEGPCFAGKKKVRAHQKKDQKCHIV